MDGLECNEIYLSSLERTNRIDSEFYKKQSITIATLMAKIGAKPITNVISVSDGNHMSISEKFVKDGIPYYRGQDIHNFFIEDANPICIDRGTFNISYMKRSHLKKGDVLLSIVGTIGESALVYSDKDATCSCKLAILRPTVISMSSILAVYLKTKYGFDQIEKFKRGAVQMGYLLEDMNQILIPNFTESFIASIHNLVEKAHDYMVKGKYTYSKMQHILLEKLQYDSSIIFTECTTVKSLSESYGTSGRLDAEYYQPKYDDLFKLLDGISTKPLGEIVEMTKSIEPGSEFYGEIGIPFIRVSDVSTMGIDTPSIRIPRNILSSIDSLYPKKDTILFSKDGSVGIAYKVEEDLEAITSSALLHFRVKNPAEILPDYLTLMLNSDIVQLQAERDSSGAIIQHWKPGDITNVVIPILPYNIQRTISEKVQQSFALRKQAEKLIKIAVKSVEIAIENGEDAAIKSLENQVN